MFALAALISFILLLFKVDANGISLLALGLVFVAAHLLVGTWPLWGTSAPWSRQP